MAELKRCPFCGSTYVDMNFLIVGADGNPTHFFVECNQCGGAVYSFATIEEATEAWNRRVDNG